MSKDVLYTLEELAQAAQITPRAVRYYAAKGLLPAPQSRGRFALYGTAHLNRLRLIAQLKHALLPLAAMRDRMLSLTETQVAALLTRSEWPLSNSDPQTGDTLADIPSDSVAATLEAQEEAYQYLLDALSARPGMDPAASEPLQVAQTSHRALFVRPGEEDKETRRQGKEETEEGEREKGKGKSVGAQFIAPDTQSSIVNRKSKIESWQRILLAPGVELHIRVPQTSETNAKLEQLIAEATALFQP